MKNTGESDMQYVRLGWRSANADASTAGYGQWGIATPEMRLTLAESLAAVASDPHTVWWIEDTEIEVEAA